MTFYFTSHHFLFFWWNETQNVKLYTLNDQEVGNYVMSCWQSEDPIEILPIYSMKCTCEFV